jgi:ribose-phosphate pyrophosphokinase
MRLCVLCVAGCPLGGLVAAELGTPPLAVETTVFPDGELDIIVPEVRNADTFVVQSTGPPVNDGLVQLVLVLDACRRAGAARVTAVVPYFGYARHDRSRTRGPLAARVAASMISERADRVIVVDPHSAALEGMMSAPLTVVSGLPALSDALAPLLPDNAVIVAPDIGAAKLAERFSVKLQLPYVIVHKTRVSGTDVHAGAVVGDVKGRSPVIVDDMISTAGTVAEAFRAVRAAGSEDTLSVVATHGLFRELSEFRLKALPLRTVLVTNTVEPPNVSFPLHVVSVAADLAQVVRMSASSGSEPTQ